MKLRSLTAALLLITSGFIAAQAFAQAPPTAAERLQQLKAQRDARIAAAKARQNQIQRPTATPTVTPPPTATTPPTATVPTTRPTATTAPTSTTTATPTATATATATATPTATATASASAKASAAPVGSAAPPASASAAPPTPPSGLDLDELKKTRPDRRKAEFGQLQLRWGELLRDQRASGELKLHAQRVAYLQRIRALAAKANDNKTVQAVDILITKEEARSADAMNALRSGALPSVAAGGTK